MTTDWDSGVETNRESTETEVVAPTKNEVSFQQEEGEKDQEIVEIPKSGNDQQQGESSCNKVPENEEIIGNKGDESGGGEITSTSSSTLDGLPNGHTTNSQQEIITCSDANSKSSAENNNTTTSATKEEIPNGKCGSAAVEVVVSNDATAS